MLSKLRISAPVPSAFCAHADAHVEPVVAVDEVVAAAALDDVAAVAAEDDVARAELVVGRARMPSGPAARCRGSPQAVDQGEVGEHAAGGAGDGDLWPRRIVAAQDVGEGRARQALDWAKRAPIGRRGTPAGGACIEGGQEQVDGDAEGVVLVGGPVEAGLPSNLSWPSLPTRCRRRPRRATRRSRRRR